MSDRAAVRDAIQAGYEDATDDARCDKVAGGILATLRERGWASLPDITGLILAAGGEIRMTGAQMLATSDLEVERYEDPATLEVVFRARRKP